MTKRCGLITHESVKAIARRAILIRKPTNAATLEIAAATQLLLEGVQRQVKLFMTGFALCAIKGMESRLLCEEEHGFMTSLL